MSNQNNLTSFPLAALCAFALLNMTPAAAAQDGMVVVRDPQTGQLRAPTADEFMELVPPRTAGLRTSVPDAAEVVTRQDGSRVLRLGERGMVYSVATRGADGKLIEHCVRGEEAAASALAKPASAARNHKEHRHEDR